ncbi:MAG: choice-of-anchor D domain-containing protein [Archangiaceae bacterium]|nr:choice-of-anchor D domain-containing protein [Archangiaceae bacterium]
MRHVIVTLGLSLALAGCGDRITQTFPVLSPPLDEYDFGTVPVLNEVLEPTIPVDNVGGATMLVSNVRLTDGEGPFTLKASPMEVQRSTAGAIVVSFVPPREQDYTATLQFETNDTEHPMVTVKLKGKGSTRAKMELDPKELDFGRVNECTTGLQTFTLKSTGTADLKLTDISFTDGTDPRFSKVGSWTTPATVPFKDRNGLNGEISLTVKFNATGGMTGAAMGGIRIRGTDPDQPEVTIPLKATVNQAPVPKIAPLGNGAPGQMVTLDGSMSMDPDGDTPLTYKWTLRSAPISASTSISAPDMASTGMTLDPMLPGSYEVQLDVTDGAGAKNCAPARQTIVASPAQKLLVEMFWDNSKTDIDLHVLRTATSVVGRAPDDCYYANLAPDWGMPGNTDDPALLRDALTGYGPEIFGYVNPIDSTYRVMAEFANEHLEPMPATNVTIRVYLFGVVKFEQSKQLTMKGQRWPAVDVTWPSGKVTPVP